MKTILVIDDSDYARKTAKFLLQKEYNVITAVNGIDGLEKTIEHKPDLILLDILMCGMDGFETCKQLKASELTKNIPVIFVTSMSERTTEGAGLSMGAVDYISKPYDGKVFLHRIKNALRKDTNDS
jgi:DNA-binding response OmpR family regulator